MADISLICCFCWAIMWSFSSWMVTRVVSSEPDPLFGVLSQGFQRLNLRSVDVDLLLKIGRFGFRLGAFVSRDLCCHSYASLLY